MKKVFLARWTVGMMGLLLHFLGMNAAYALDSSMTELNVKFNSQLFLNSATVGVGTIDLNAVTDARETDMIKAVSYTDPSEMEDSADLIDACFADNPDHGEGRLTIAARDIVGSAILARRTLDGPFFLDSSDIGPSLVLIVYSRGKLSCEVGVFFNNLSDVNALFNMIQEGSVAYLVSRAEEGHVCELMPGSVVHCQAGLEKILHQ